MQTFSYYRVYHFGMLITTNNNTCCSRMSIILSRLLIITTYQFKVKRLVLKIQICTNLTIVEVPIPNIRIKDRHTG